jgi:PAS domain S-box-containing protein
VTTADGTTLEAVAEAIPHIVWLASADGGTDYFNDRGTHFTGLPRDTGYGWAWVDFVHGDDAPRAVAGWEHATSTVTPFELRFRVRRHDGEFRWLDCRALPLRGDGGDVVRWIGTADDIEARSLLDEQVDGLRSALDVATPELAPRELAVVRLVVSGHTNAEIASILDVSVRTIESSRSRIRTQLGVRSRADLVRVARANGLLDLS